LFGFDFDFSYGSRSVRLAKYLQDLLATSALEQTQLEGLVHTGQDKERDHLMYGGTVCHRREDQQRQGRAQARQTAGSSARSSAERKDEAQSRPSVWLHWLEAAEWTLQVAALPLFNPPEGKGIEKFQTVN